MTATVTPPFIVDKFARTYSGDDRARFWHYLGSNTPGQLWQRVAENAESRAPLGTHSERYRDAVERAMTRDCGNHADMDVIARSRGPRLGGGYTTARARQASNTHRMAASGIIRAGERVK
jgi:hypothetical protein